MKKEMVKGESHLIIKQQVISDFLRKFSEWPHLLGGQRLLCNNSVD